jgi:hypothetical protein
MIKLDGLNVFLPNWKKCHSCAQLDKDQLIIMNTFRSDLGEQILFSSSNKKAPYYLGAGWSWLENWGVWSDDVIASINLPSPNGEIHGIKLRVKPFVVHDKKREQIVEIVLNDKPVTYQKLILKESEPTTIIIPFNKKFDLGNLVNIKITLENPISPKSLQMGNDDDRKLGIGLISASFY